MEVHQCRQEKYSTALVLGSDKGIVVPDATVEGEFIDWRLLWRRTLDLIWLTRN